MAEHDKTDHSEQDIALEQEIRRERKFSLNEALGRMADQGMMKGGSPVPPHQQAEFEIGRYLRDHLSDPSGILPLVIVRHVKRSEQFLHDPTEPLSVLSGNIQRLLQSPDLLNELVREADMEWGQMHEERPHFEREGDPPHPDDPYTVESLRAALSRLLEQLPADDVSRRHAR